MSADVLSGAAQGAAAGSALGPVGTVIGGVLGAIGGLFSSKSKKYKRRAAAEEAKIKERQAAVQRRDIIREAFIARQTALAAGASESGGLQSSAVQGALSSINSQGTFNLNYFDTQYASTQTRDRYLSKAGKYADRAEGISAIISAGSQLIDAGVIKKPTKTPSPTKNISSGFTKGFTEGFYLNLGMGK